MDKWMKFKFIDKEDGIQNLISREVGYCQGSAFIVGLLLMQVMKFCLIQFETFLKLNF